MDTYIIITTTLVLHNSILSDLLCNGYGIMSTEYFTRIDPNVYYFTSTTFKESNLSRHRCACLCALRPECSGFIWDVNAGNTCVLGKGLSIYTMGAPTFLRQWMYEKISRGASTSGPTTVSPPTCRLDLGYRQLTYDGFTYCLKVPGLTLSYNDASLNCQQDGASLIYANGLEDFKDYDYFQEVFAEFGYHPTDSWVGLEVDANGNWAWSYNGAVLTDDEKHEIDWEMMLVSDLCTKYVAFHNEYVTQKCAAQEMFICEIVESYGPLANVPEPVAKG